MRSNYIKLLLVFTTISSLSVLHIFYAPRTAYAATELLYDQTWVLPANTSQSGMATVDSDGNFFLAGQFSGTGDIDISSGTYIATANGSTDIYISKYTEDGTREWIRKWGGNGSYANSDQPQAIAVDNDGNLFIAGYFIDETNVDFDGTSGTDYHSTTGRSHFITKYNADGSYGWTRVYAGNQQPERITTDSSGNVYIVGEFSTAGGTVDFDGTAGVDLIGAQSTQDMYLTKYNSDGSYGWTRTLGGGTNHNMWGRGIDLDSSGNIFFCGRFSQTIDFDPVGTENITPNGGDIFVTSYDSSGNYTGNTFTFGSTTAGAYCNALRLDENNDVYMTGRFYSESGFDFDGSAGTDIRTTGSDYDFYFTKYNTDESYAWTRTVTASSDQMGTDIDFDLNGNIFVLGDFRGTDIDLDGTTGTDLWTSLTAADDAFISKYEPDGDYIWSASVSNFMFNTIAVDSNANIYIATDLIRSDVDFDVTSGTDLISPVSSGSTVLARYIDAEVVSITDLAGNLNVTDVDSSLDAEVPSSQLYGSDKTIRIENTTGLAIADIIVDMTASRSWGDGTSVSGDSDNAAGKAYIHNLTTAPGSSSSYTLYIPRLGTVDSVIICPNATSLSAVTDTCPGGYQLDASDPDVSQVTLGSQNYWAVANLTGTGGMEGAFQQQSTTTTTTQTSGTTTTDDDGLDLLPETGDLPDTGLELTDNQLKFALGTTLVGFGIALKYLLQLLSTAHLPLKR